MFSTILRFALSAGLIAASSAALAANPNAQWKQVWSCDNGALVIDVTNTGEHQVVVRDTWAVKTFVDAGFKANDKGEVIFSDLYWDQNSQSYRYSSGHVGSAYATPYYGSSWVDTVITVYAHRAGGVEASRSFYHCQYQN